MYDVDLLGLPLSSSGMRVSSLLTLPHPDMEKEIKAQVYGNYVNPLTELQIIYITPERAVEAYSNHVDTSA